MFSHADTLTGCPLDANNIIKFRAYRRLICYYPPRMSRETWVGMSMAFSSSMTIFISYVPGMHVVVFTRSYSVARALTSTPICCIILQYATMMKTSADTWAIDPWVRVVPSFLRVLVSNCMRTSRWWCVSCGNMKFICDIYHVPHAYTRGLVLWTYRVSPEPSAARMQLLTLWLSPTGYCCKERQLIIRSRVYEQSCMVSLAIIIT